MEDLKNKSVYPKPPEKYGTIQDCKQVTWEVEHPGLNLLEYFTGQSMKGYSANPQFQKDLPEAIKKLGISAPEIKAKLSIADAKAIIAELEKEGEKDNDSSN